jgi:hypothetical protein
MHSTTELMAAFKRTNLWRMGWTFQKAVECEATRTGLNCIVVAERRKQEREGHPAPLQPELI